MELHRANTICTARPQASALFMGLRLASPVGIAGGASIEIGRPWRLAHEFQGLVGQGRAIKLTAKSYRDSRCSMRPAAQSPKSVETRGRSRIPPE